jgi:hypothetical protein
MEFESTAEDAARRRVEPRIRSRAHVAGLIAETGVRRGVATGQIKPQA